ncbi:MAG: MATE family efflux transporter [Clostridia bacterium]|nr:MATE family efflux transporter [Clostridia bacterium]
MKNMSQKERQQMMLNAPVHKVIPKLAVPSIISMLITAIYNMADTFFVSQIGTSASGAVGVIFSAMAIIQAVAFMIGMGSGTNVSQALGAGDTEKAKRYAATGFFTAFIVGVIIMLLGLANIDPLVRFLGATETIAPYARDYAQYIFFGAPFIMCSFAMNNLLRFEGLAFYGMIGITSGGILNMVLDPILIFGFGMGTAGAALATAISQFVSFAVLLIMTNTKPDAIKISIKNFRPTLAMYGRIINNGFPSLGRQGIASVATIILNTTAGAYGDAAIAAMAIVSRFVMFINSTVIGIGQGFQPVCSFSFGAGKYARVREAFFFCLKVTTILLTVLAVCSFLLSESIVTVFRRDDPLVIEIGTLALRLQILTLPLWGFIVMSNMLTQSIGYGIRATIISTARQGLFLIPALLVLPRMFGLLGLQMAQPVSDALSCCLTFVIVSGILKELKQKETKTL